MSATMTAKPGSVQRDSEIKRDSETKMERSTANTDAAQSLRQARPMHEEIASLAYALWQRRGCPEGSAESDWFEAEQQLVGSSEHRETSTARR